MASTDSENLPQDLTHPQNPCIPSTDATHTHAPLFPSRRELHQRTTSSPRPHTSAHAHQHSHNHEHNHVQGVSSTIRLSLALGITLSVFLAEIIASSLSGSLSLAADAAHMAVDSSGLLIALIATFLAQKPRSDRHTWGWARSEILATALQAGMLFAVCVGVAWEAIPRLLSPTPVNGLVMSVLGITGLIANIIALIILTGGRHDSLNMRGAFLEVLNDALGSFAVIVAAVLSIYVGWWAADAVASLVIAALMGPRALSLLRRCVTILLEHTPQELNLGELRQHFLSIEGVQAIHDMHVSVIATGIVALTAHVSVDEKLSAAERDTILHTLQECTFSHFPLTITHSTIQIEGLTHAEHEKPLHA
ncbi:cation diffusion facilitator family transporter [Schaalia sp. lx-100]|uniref:cation diffusion facilitator family transporter n=1 Tax=Schaalia sp. lx-100 TaxID=2899081 RepID=UPI001E2B21D8|nr:cation diffusion facilitator family transporter [Schaalia sp. lx-100]MCD4556798.1 cation diffusion facilitator family transporter [Schaalia sp. lx-100]